jgi:hypothetical protein
MTASTMKTREKLCPACGAGLTCGPGTGRDGAGCWCADLPPVMPVLASADCLCPPCLREAIAAQLTSHA